jgi:2-polyprenyl-6-methoxyphenol hydroxylase-like FAD-dependent oxidoreductase
VRGSNAVVIGASISGLCAAQVLSEFYEQVTVVERDALPDAAYPRAGVPQGRHVHGLLTGGLLAFRELFPGLVEDLVTQGAPAGDLLAHGRSYFDGLRMAKTYGDLPGLAITRPYLEWQIRRRLQEQANVQILSTHTVTGLVASPDRRVIIGIRVISTNNGKTGATLPADLVVDASGRQSRAPDWLSEIGYLAPPEERLRIDIAYASWSATAPANLLGDDLGIVVGFTRANPCGGSLMRVEGDKWLVSLAGYSPSAPPATLEGCLEFAQRLAVPDLHHALQETTARDRPAHYRLRHSVRRHYERLARFPEGLVVLGDAACCFNPVYGQGMSVAAGQALILREGLRQEHRPVASLRRQLARAGKVAWTLSVTSDLRLPWVSGRRTLLVRAANGYTTMLFRAAHRDPAVTRGFFRVAHLVEPPLALARPNFTARLLLGSVRRVGRSTPPTSPAVRSTAAGTET